MDVCAIRSSLMVAEVPRYRRVQLLPAATVSVNPYTSILDGRNSGDGPHLPAIPIVIACSLADPIGRGLLHSLLVHHEYLPGTAVTPTVTDSSAPSLTPQLTQGLDEGSPALRISPLRVVCRSQVSRSSIIVPVDVKSNGYLGLYGDWLSVQVATTGVKTRIARERSIPFPASQWTHTPRSSGASQPPVVAYSPTRMPRLRAQITPRQRISQWGMTMHGNAGEAR